MKLNRIFLTIAAALLFLATASVAAEKCEGIEAGTKAYNENDFERAIDEWRTCVDEGIVNADLYYNLGNAYYRSGKLGFAIFYYKSALRLHPSDDDIQHNLNFAQTKTRDKEGDEEENPILEGLMNLHHAISLKSQMNISLVLFWAIALVILARRFVNGARGKNICTGVVFGMSVILCTVGASALYKMYTLETDITGVVTASSADVTSAPNDKSQTLNTLSEGTSFEVIGEQGNFAEIRLGEKIRGFVKLSEVGIVK